MRCTAGSECDPTSPSNSVLTKPESGRACATPDTLAIRMIIRDGAVIADVTPKGSKTVPDPIRIVPL